MKLTEPLTLSVAVKETGSNNVARLQGEGISASSTNSPRVAIDVAVKKLIARNAFGPVEITVANLFHGQNCSQWLVTLTPKGNQP